MADLSKQTPAPKERKPLTPEERKLRYAELRKRMGRSKIKVDGPEGISTFWALKGNEYEMARLDWLGYKLVVEDMKPGAKKRFDAAGLKADGTYVLGDVILMEADTESYQLQKQIELDDFEEMRQGIKRGFVEKAHESHAPVFELNDKNEKVPVAQG